MASKLVLVTLFLAAVVAAASARPRFLAIPIEDIEFLRGPAPYPAFAQQQQQPLLRVRRATPNGDEFQGAASQPRASSGYGGNDYVDYGAYTGGYGAFGWYTDHPVGNHGGSY